MKKIVAFLISMLVLTTSAFANASIPKELMSYPENFTAECKLSVSVDDNSDIRSLIEEFASKDNSITAFLGMDFFNFLSAMFEYNNDVTVKANISPDYTKIKLAMTTSEVFSSVVSSNLNYTINSKSGLWLDVDLTNEETPKADLIFMSPTSEKYRHIGAGEFIPKESLPLIKTYLSPNVTQKIKDKYAQLLNENCTVEKSGTEYKISMTNDNLQALMKAISEYNPFYEEGALGEEFDEELVEEMTSDFENINILGKDGITASCTLKNGQISRTESKVDISLNISEIAKAMGEEWPFEAQGIINIKLSEIDNYSKIGTTDVELPELTESNSISLNKIIEENKEPEENYADLMEYPYGYVSVYDETVFVEDGNYYVPLRSILEDGYDDFVTIDYQDGVVTVTSEYFDKFNTLTVKIPDNKVYTDGTEQDCGNVMLVNDTTYVDSRLFTEVFGWYLSDISHSILEDSYIISFWTEE